MTIPSPSTARSTIRRDVILTAVMALVIAAAGFGFYKAVQHVRASSQATVTITVQSKQRICDPGQPPMCRYEIYTDVGVFADKDEITAHKLNSDALFGQLMYDGVYEVTVRGVRHDNLAIYPNIIAIVKTVKPGHPNPATVIAPATP